MFLLHLVKTIFCARQINLAITLPHMWKFQIDSCLDLEHLHNLLSGNGRDHLVYDEFLFLCLCRKKTFADHKEEPSSRINLPADLCLDLTDVNKGFSLTSTPVLQHREFPVATTRWRSCTESREEPTSAAKDRTGNRTLRCVDD